MSSACFFLQVEDMELSFGDRSSFMKNFWPKMKAFCKKETEGLGTSKVWSLAYGLQGANV